MKHYIALAATAFFLITALGFAGEDVPVTPLLTTTTTVSGQPITVPEHPKLQAMLLTVPPGKTLPVHKHPYARYAYVEKGEIDVTLVAEKKTIHYKAGDFFAEIIDGWHYGKNNGKVPAELLIIDQMPQGVEGNTVVRE